MPQVFEKANDFSGFGNVDEKVVIAGRVSKNLSEKSTFFFAKFIHFAFF